MNLIVGPLAVEFMTSPKRTYSLRAYLLGALFGLFGASSAAASLHPPTSQPIPQTAAIYTARGIEQDRDLRFYDQGGFFDAGMGPDFQGYGIRPGSDEYERGTRALREVRRFVWEHWKAQRRGYVAITLRHSDRTATVHMFIEPDKRGRWRIVRRVVTPGKGVADARPAYGLRRVGVRREILLEDYLGDDDARPSDRYVVVFLSDAEHAPAVKDLHDYL